MAARLASLKCPPLCELRDSMAEARRPPRPAGQADPRHAKGRCAAHGPRGRDLSAAGPRPHLDHLLDLTEDGQRFLVELEAREREATGIPTLKVRYNRVFGYYIEITSAHLRTPLALPAQADHGGRASAFSRRSSKSSKTRSSRPAPAKSRSSSSSLRTCSSRSRS